MRFGDLTVLFGANDTGKTRILKAISQAGELLESLSRGTRPALPSSRFFVEFSNADIAALLKFDPLAEPPEDRPDASPLAQWWQASGREQRERFRRSRAFVLEAPDVTSADYTSAALWAYWCDEVEPGGYDRSSPITLEVPLLPKVMELPTREVGWLLREVTDAVLVWLAHVRWATVRRAGDRANTIREALELIKRTDEGDVLIETWVDAVVIPFLEEVEKRLPPQELWAHEDPETRAIAERPIASPACAHLGDLATKLAPEFVRSRYSIRVAPPHGWDAAATVGVFLVAREGGNLFPYAEVADGLRLWVEIAVLEAADAMRRVELSLRQALHDLESEIDSRYYSIDWDDDAISLHRAVDSYVRLLNQALMSPVDPPFERTLAQALTLAAGFDTSAWMDRDQLREQISKGAARMSTARPSVYLIDEPERHLNPRLQRAAAQWLVDLLRTRG